MFIVIFMKKFFLCLLLFLVAFLPSGARDIGRVEDLAGLKTAVMLGSVADIEMSSNHGEVQLKRFGSPAEMIRALEMGKVDAVITDSTMLMTLQENKHWIKTCFSGFLPSDISAVFSYEKIELCDRFNSFLAEKKLDGTHRRLMEKWNVENVDTVKMPPFPQAREGVLRVGVIGGNIPFSFYAHERFQGIEPELLEMFASSMGYGVEYHEYEFGAISAALQSSRIDMAIASMSVTAERQRSLLFSDPYFHTCCVCITNAKLHSVPQESFFRGLARSFHNNIVAQKRYLLILEGLENTLYMSLLSILLGTILGAFMAWRSFGPRKRLWHAFLKVYGALMHGIPLLVLLLIMFYLVFAHTGFTSVSIAVVTFTVFLAYQCCEIFITGVESVPPGQMKAAISLGFTRFQGFVYVVLPQALKNIIPSYEAELVNIIKETSVAGFIAVIDLTKATDIIQSRTFDAFFPLMTGAAIYMLVCMLVGRLLKWCLKKVNRR